MRLVYLAALAAVLVVMTCGAPVGAQENATQETAAPETTALREIPDTPAATRTNRGTIVSVVHKGNDPVGLRLVYHLKEELNRSSLFDLTTQDTRKVQIVLHTMEEFGNRPELSSTYSVVWLYSENDATLKYYLQNEVGLVNGVTVQQTAEALAAKTDDVSAQYSYLFE